jgi:hypothetical protein
MYETGSSTPYLLLVEDCPGDVMLVAISSGSKL